MYENLPVLDDDLLLLVDHERILVINPTFCLLELLTGQFAFQGELRASKWRRLLYKQQHEVADANPARGLRIIFLPSLNESQLVVLGYNTGIELLRILQPLDDRGYGEIHYEPRYDERK